jgi:hypothetical protein
MIYLQDLNFFFKIKKLTIPDYVIIQRKDCSLVELKLLNYNSKNLIINKLDFINFKNYKLQELTFNVRLMKTGQLYFMIQSDIHTIIFTDINIKFLNEILDLDNKLDLIKQSYEEYILKII